MTANHGRRGRPWRRIRAQVLQEEPRCHFCGKPSTTVDHVMPLSTHPQLAHVRSNLRGVCRDCNLHKSNHQPPRTVEVTKIKW